MPALIENIETAARMLRGAYGNKAIEPLRGMIEPNDGEAAYAIQLTNTRYWQSQGRQIVGHKVGLTAKAVQSQMGVNQPDYGVLFADTLIPDGGELQASAVLQPMAEAEIAVRLSRDLDDPTVDATGIANAIGRVFPAIEIVDSRIADWRITFADTVADNGSSAFFLLGEDGLPLEDLDLYSCGMVLEVNGGIASVGAGAACLGHPLNAVAWLAQTMAKRGQPLRAGEIVMTGALGPMVPIAPGDNVKAIIGGIGTCSFTFGKKRS